MSTRKSSFRKLCCVGCYMSVLQTMACSDSNPTVSDPAAGSSGAETPRPTAGRGGSTSSGGAGGRSSAAGGGNGGTAGSTPSAGQSGNGATGGVAATGGTLGSAAGSGNAGSGGSGPIPATEVLYVGSNTTDVTVFGMDTQTGALTKRGTVNAGQTPSYLAISPDKKFLYAVNENDGGASSVVAFTIDPGDGHLTQINKVATKGEGAPHLTVDPTGKWVIVAHYTGGQISVLPIAANGGVMEPTTVDKGPGGGCQNAHQAVFDRSGKNLFVPCLGSNYVIQYKFDAGKLSPNTPAMTATTMSPRHIAFDPAEQFAYLLSEYESTITYFKYDAATGTLTDPKLVNGFEATKGDGAHIVVHPGGKWLYTTNRKENSLGLFSIGPDGAPKAVSFEKAMIDNPRDFSVDPLGKFLILANQDGAQNVLVYSIDRSNGALTRVQVAPVGGNPVFTQAIVLP
jgi:6-phosphogluconolactonase